MEIINLISSNFFLLIFIFFVGASIIINIVISSAKKTGEVAVKGSIGIFSLFFKLIKNILIFIKNIFEILFLFLFFMFAYFSKRK